MKKMKLDFFKNRNNLIVLILIGVLLVIISPVSYTHLDVYKRQP